MQGVGKVQGLQFREKGECWVQGKFWDCNPQPQTLKRTFVGFGVSGAVVGLRVEVFGDSGI